MKKSRKKIGILTALVGLIGSSALSYADALPSIVGLISDKFGYRDGVQPSILSITPDEIVISSENVYDEYKELVKQFSVFYSPDLINDITDTENVSEKFVKAIDNESLDPVEIHLSADEDGLERGTSYYAMIVPRGYYEEEGLPSDWICFNLEEERVAQGDACKNFDTMEGSEVFGVAPIEEQGGASSESIQEIEHSSAKTADMTLANISCKATENKAECVWTAVEGADRVDIFLFDFEKGKDYLIGSPKMTAEYFDYDLTFDGQQRLTFKPSGAAGGKEVIFTFNAFKTPEVTKNTEKVDIKTPTGPKENAAIILVLSALGYGIYRKFAKKY